MTMASFSPLTVYYCSDPADLAFCQTLDLHLSPFKSNGRIQIWSDEQIFAGQEREKEREKHLSAAQILILLLSPDFLASEGGQRQISIALQRHQTEDAVVIPILVRPCSWQEVGLGVLQILPREQKALSTRSHPEETWQEIVADISCVIATIRQWVVVVYAPEDRDVVERLRQNMKTSKLMLWSLEHKKLSSDLSKDTDVRDAIRNASIVVLIASPAVSGSRVVKTQINLAADYRRSIIGFWVRGENWDTSSVGDWHVDEVLDARLERYETAQKALLTYLKQYGTLVPSSKRLPSQREPRNPYKGLQPFTAKDARDFFGREALIDEMATTLEKILVQEKNGNQLTRLMTVLGASGSGKSSAVMAGLLPCLQRGEVFDSQEWIYLDRITPGTHPLEELATALSQLVSMPDAVALHHAFLSDSLRTLHLFARQLAGSSQRKVVLFIDQFEEVFTLRVSEEERQGFFDLLITAVTEPQGPLLVILTLRADFYDRPMQYPALYRLLEAHRISVLPLKREGLRRVIEQPTQLPDVQLTFEEDLVGDLLFEMHEQNEALPLLQFTLDQLFTRRRGHQLTLQAYNEVGGVRGAISQYAEAVYQDQLTEKQQKLVRDVFLRLIGPGESELDTTRRRANRSEFTFFDPLLTQQVQTVLEIFIKARLLTINQVSGKTLIEVSHEALIREWPRLNQWLREARDDIRLQQIISQDVEEWTQRSMPTDRLYRGSELNEALIWVQRNTPSIDVMAFLQTSITKHEQEEVTERAQQARELDLQRRAARRQRYVIGMMGVSSTVIGIALIVILALQTNMVATQGRLLTAQRNLLASLPPSVTNFNDHGSGSLREAISQAVSGGSVTFARNLRGTIILTSGPLVIRKNLAISGLGATTLSISGENKSRVFDLEGNITVTISNITIQQGYSHSDGGGIYINGNGGTILILTNTIISHNIAVNGGGIYNNESALTLTNTTISDNIASHDGGGIYDTSGGLTVTNTTISGNEAKHDGGGINNSAQAILENSTISGNIAGHDGGGIDALQSSVYLLFCTIYENTAVIGGGIAIEPIANEVSMDASILAENRAQKGPDVFGAISLLSPNLIEKTSDANLSFSPAYTDYPDPRQNFITGKSPNLGPLQNNGGLTQTYALLAGSPAIDVVITRPGDPVCPTSYITDQRGMIRPGDNKKACDIGAYESSY